MPKRKMTVARMLQINKWQLAGLKARKLKIPRGATTGKKILLYHRTDPISARMIVDQQKFNPAAGRVSGKTSKDWPIFFSNKLWGSASGYGRSAVSVAVPKKQTVIDPAFAPFVHLARGEVHYEVHQDVLKGRKIKRVI